MTDTPEARQRPALGDERLVFSLANSEDDRRSHGGPTLHVYHRGGREIGEADGDVTIDHLDRKQAVKLMHSLQQHVARLASAVRQYDARVQRLRSRGYRFEYQSDKGHSLYRHDELIEAGLLSKEDALIKAEMHITPKSEPDAEPTT
jgi:hypothetical protein